MKSFGYIQSLIVMGLPFAPCRALRVHLQCFYYKQVILYFLFSAYCLCEVQCTYPVLAAREIKSAVERGKS